MKVKPTHMLVIGSTQSGKTTYTNELHRTFPSISVFVDTKGIDPLWGVHVPTLRDLRRHLLRAQKLVFDPPRGPAGIDWERARAELLAFWVTVQDTARKVGWTSDRPPWIQLVVDEAQVWLDSCSDIIEDMAARGLGMGLRLVLVTQYPAGLNGELGTRIRNNLDTRVVYHLADEGRRCIRVWGWPVDDIDRETLPQYRFATCHPRLGWRFHPPRPWRPAPTN